MPTSSLAGDRSRRARNPRDITGGRYAQQAQKAEAQKAAQKELASLDIDAIKREAKRAGWSEGYDAGSEAGQEYCARALMALYQDGGIEAVENLLKEWIDADDEPGDETGEDK